MVEAVRRYAEVAGPNVADTFEREFDATVRLLLRFPRLGTRGKSGSRSLRLDGFPYTLHDRIDGELIRILAVAH